MINEKIKYLENERYFDLNEKELVINICYNLKKISNLNDSKYLYHEYLGYIRNIDVLKRPYNIYALDILKSIFDNIN